VPQLSGLCGLRCKLLQNIQQLLAFLQDRLDVSLPGGPAAFLGCLARLRFDAVQLISACDFLGKDPLAEFLEASNSSSQARRSFDL